MDSTNYLSLIILTIIVLDIVFRFRKTAYPIIQKAFNQKNNYELSIQLKSLMSDRTPYAQIGTDEYNNIIVCNLRAEQKFGWTQEEMLGKNISILISKDSYLIYNTDIEKWRTGSISEIVDNEDGIKLVGLHRSGILFPIHLKLICINDKGYKTLGVYIRNISKETIIEKNIADTLKLCKETLITAKTGGWKWNLDTGQLSFDENSCKLFNVPVTGIMTASLFIDLIYPNDQLNCTLTTNDAFTKKDDYYEYRFRRLQQDGSLMWLYCKGCMVFDDHGSISEVHGILKSISKDTSLEEKNKNNDTID